MKSYRKLFIVLLLSFSLVVVPIQSRAIAPIVAVAAYLLEITGGSILVSDLVAGMTGVVAGVLWYECSKFRVGGTCDNAPSSLPASQAPGSPTITVKLNPDAQRSNPDPTKFNDPASGARDVTPKTFVAPTPTGATGEPAYPSGFQTYTGDKTYMAPDGQVFQWQDGKGNTYVGRDSTALAALAVSKGGVDFTCASTSGCTWKSYSFASGDATCVRQEYRTNDSNSYQGMFQYCSYPGQTSCPSGAASTGGQCTQMAVPSQETACGPGYIKSGDSCQLTDASQVKKPADAPCEMLWDSGNGSFRTDAAAPGCAGAVDSPNFTVQNPDNSSMSVQPNSNGGFDITKTNANGSSTTVKTGPYQPAQGGYVIIQTVQVTQPGQTPDGQGDGCGIPGKPACNVQFSSDAQAEAAGQSAQQGITDGLNTLKGMLENVDPNKFNWSFIPQIPTASCENPRVQNPLTSQFRDVDICGWFNKFAFFLNGVFGLLCLYGCVREVQKAMKA